MVKLTDMLLIVLTKHENFMKNRSGKFQYIDGILYLDFDTDLDGDITRTGVIDGMPFRDTECLHGKTRHGSIFSQPISGDRPKMIDKACLWLHRDDTGKIRVGGISADSTFEHREDKDL